MARDLHQDEELETKPLDSELFRRLWVYIRPQSSKLLFVVGLLLIITVIELTTVKVMATAIDVFVHPFDPMRGGAPADTTLFVKGIIWSAVLLVGLYAVQAILMYRQMNTLVMAGQLIISDIRMKLFAHVQRLPAAYFDRHPTGKLVTRLTNDVNNIHEAFSGVLVYLLKDVFLMVGILWVMFTVSSSLALVLLAPLPLLIAVSMFFRILNRRAYRGVRESLSHLNSFMHETFSGISVIKVFVQEARQQARFAALNEKSYRANIWSVIIIAIFIPVVGFMITIPTALLLWYGGLCVLSGALTIGVIFMMINYLRMFYEPIADFSQKYILMQSAMASAERIFQVLDTPATQEDPNTKYTAFPEPFRGKIEFRDVSFSYDGKKMVLDHVSFVLEPGETLALVGDTGSGKTTITSLLCRFYEITSGTILVDDIDIHDVPLDVLRRQIAIVMQEPFIFSRTIAENIALQTPGITRDDIKRAAVHIGADDFISKLPEGYDEHLNERGSNLSSGQRQLIAFTRALAHNRAVIILDEATASIDSATEQIVQKATLTLLEKRTAIVVAHRLSTIRHAHKILVLQRGVIIESGTHETLVAAGGHYAEMVQKQFREAVE